MSGMDHRDYSGKLDAVKLRPIGDFILVEVLESSSRRKSGLMMVGKSESAECSFGRVISTGKGQITDEDGAVIPASVKPDDTVLFMDYAGERIYMAEGKFRFLRDHGIWAVVDLDAYGAVKAVRPLQDKVVVRMARDEKSLSGKLHLPSNPQTRFCRAEVVSVGPGMQNTKTAARVPMSVVPGDCVVSSRYAGATLKILGIEHRILQDMDLEAVFEGEMDVIASGGFSEPQDAGRVRDAEIGAKMVDEGIAKLGERKGG